MLILLPLLVYLLAVALGIGRARVPLHPLLLAQSVVAAAVACGAIVAVSSETLGFLHALDRVGVAAIWLVAAVGMGVYGWRRGDLQSAVASLRATRITLNTLEAIALAGMGLIAAALLIVAWISPPNNVDSLLYHVARVAHWAQDKSLDHYATARQHQLLKPIWAETAILHLRLLWGGDRPSNLVQWSSMALSVIGVAGLAARLGASRGGQLLAAACALTIPSGILQASSTQNDYGVALWTVCAAFYVLTSKQRELTRWEGVGLGSALGLGFLTKGTFYVYGPPLMVWYFLPRFWTHGLRKTLVHVAVLGLVAASLNAGFWIRNFETFGGPYGPSDWLQQNLGIRFLPSRDEPRSPEPPRQVAVETPESDSVGVPVPPSGDDTTLPVLPAPGTGVFAGLRSWSDRVSRTVAFNLVTPSGRVNQWVRLTLERFPDTFSKSFLAEWGSVAWSHEDTTPSTLHLALALAAVVGTFLVLRAPNAALARKYGLLILAMFGLLPVVIGHGSSIWGMRYQLPFFVLAAPLIGGVISSWRRLGPAPLWGIALCLAAVPWVLFNNTRPLIGHVPWPTRVGSIFTTPPSVLMFSVSPRLKSDYEAAVRIVKGSSCRQVGLRIDSDDMEYLFWWLFQAPESGVRIETVYTVPRLEPLLDSEFHPCAVLCTICADRSRLHGLPLVSDLEWIAVFSGTSFVWDPDG